jgi:hypothetical protein
VCCVGRNVGARGAGGGLREGVFWNDGVLVGRVGIKLLKAVLVGMRGCNKA